MFIENLSFFFVVVVHSHINLGCNHFCILHESFSTSAFFFAIVKVLASLRSTTFFFFEAGSVVAEVVSELLTSCPFHKRQSRSSGEGSSAPLRAHRCNRYAFLAIVIVFEY